MGVYPNPQDAFHPLYESSSCSLPALDSKHIRDRVSIINLMDSTRNFQNRASATNLQNSNHPYFGVDDPCTPDISPSNQENYMKWHMDATTSLHSPGRTSLLRYAQCYTASQSDDNSRGSRYFRLEPHEIIPCSEYQLRDLKIIESSFYSPEKNSSLISHGSDPSEYQVENSSSYHSNQDDKYYPVAVSSKFHSDSWEKRTSVFSRLSGLPKASVENSQTCKPNLDLSLDELVDYLSSRKKHWIKMTEVLNLKKPTRVPAFKKLKLVSDLENVNKVPDQFDMLDDERQLENADQLESQDTISYSTRELSGSEEGTENSSIPFVNFKRRSEAQRVAAETETSSSVERKDNEVSLAKCKRRKLLRPSFGEGDVCNKVGVAQNIGMKNNFSDFDSKNTDDLQRNLVTGAMGVGRLSPSSCILYSEEAPRDIEEENAGAERNPECDKSCEELVNSAEGIEAADLQSNPCISHTTESAVDATAKFFGDRLLCEVVGNEMKTSHQPPVCSAVSMGMGVPLSKPCSDRRDLPAANMEEDHAMLGKLSSDVSKDRKTETSCCNLVMTESVPSGETLSTPFIKFL